MSEDAGAAAEGTGTGPDSTDSAATTTTAATQAATPAGAQGTPSSPAGTSTASGDDDAAELLASMATDGDTGQDTPDPLQAQLDHWKTIAKKQEQRAKSNAAAARELEEIKRSQMSDQQRLEAERDQYRAEAASNAEQLHRVMAAAAYDLPTSLLDHLGGGTEEEINARAEAFAAAINERAAATTGTGGNGHPTAEAAAAAAQQQPPNPVFRTRIPVESLRAGAAPATDQVARNNNDVFRQMLGR